MAWSSCRASCATATSDVACGSLPSGPASRSVSWVVCRAARSGSRSWQARSRSPTASPTGAKLSRVVSSARPIPTSAPPADSSPARARARCVLPTPASPVTSSTWVDPSRARCQARRTESRSGSRPTRRRRGSAGRALAGSASAARSAATSSGPGSRPRCSTSTFRAGASRPGSGERLRQHRRGRPDRRPSPRRPRSGRPGRHGRGQGVHARLARGRREHERQPGPGPSLDPNVLVRPADRRRARRRRRGLRPAAVHRLRGGPRAAVRRHRRPSRATTYRSARAPTASRSIPRSRYSSPMRCRSWRCGSAGG